MRDFITTHFYEKKYIENAKHLARSQQADISMFDIHDDDNFMVDLSAGEFKKFKRVVIKKFKKGNWKVEIENEIRSLKLLNNDNHFPNIITDDYPNKIMFMNYVGKPLSSVKNNLPRDWKEQLYSITNTLNSRGIYHNDMCKQNFLINEKNIIYLIDFAWASIKVENYPFINITSYDIEKNNNLDVLLDICSKRVEKKRRFYNDRTGTLL